MRISAPSTAPPATDDQDMKPRGVGEWITLAVLALSAVVWAVRLEGRVDAQERENKAVLAQLREDVVYIRSRLDQALARP